MEKKERKKPVVSNRTPRMKYNAKEFYEFARAICMEQKLITLTDLVGYLPVQWNHFYDMFKEEENYMNELKLICHQNAIIIKNNILTDWRSSDDYRKQRSMLNMIISNKERLKLNGFTVETSSENSPSEQGNEVVHTVRFIDFSEKDME